MYAQQLLGAVGHTEVKVPVLGDLYVTQEY